MDWREARNDGTIIRIKLRWIGIVVSLGKDGKVHDFVDDFGMKILKFDHDD